MYYSHPFRLAKTSLAKQSTSHCVVFDTQADFVGAIEHIAPMAITNSPEIPEKNGAFCRVDVGIDPYAILGGSNIILLRSELPDFLRVLPDRSVGREVTRRRDVHQALAAKLHAVAVVAVCLQSRLLVRGQVLEEEVVVRPVPACAIEQRRIELTQLGIRRNRAVHKRIDRTADARIAVIHIARAVALADVVDLLDARAEDIVVF